MNICSKNSNSPLKHPTEIFLNIYFYIYSDNYIKIALTINSEPACIHGSRFFESHCSSRGHTQGAQLPPTHARQQEKMTVSRFKTSQPGGPGVGPLSPPQLRSFL